MTRRPSTLRVAVGEISDANPIMLALAVGNLGLAESSTGAESHADPLLDRLADVLRAVGADRSVPAAVLLLARGERARRRGDPQGALSRAALRDRHPGGHAPQRVARRRVPPARGDRAPRGPRPPARSEAVDRAQEILDRLPDPGALVARAAALRAALAAPARHATEFGEELSAREVVVLRLAADGLQQREIADQLFISYNTVKSHLKAAYRKLGVASRDAAIERLQQLDAAPAHAPTTRVRSRAGGPSPRPGVSTMSG